MKSKINFTYIIIAVLVIIILLQRGCDGKTISEPIVVTKYDTIWKETHDTITK